MGEIMIKNKSFIHSMHNDIQCIESINQNDKGTSRQYWFTANMLANIFDISKDTVRRRVESLAEWGEVTVAQNCATVQMSSSSGAVNDTVLYDLQVFNKLAMDLRTKAAMEIRNKFSDILIQVETTGSYNIQKSTPSYEIEDPIERAKAWIAEQEAKLALEAENNELTTKNKALKADNDNLTQVLTDTSEKLITAIRTKAQINDKRTASLMGKVSGQSRKITKLENDLNTANDNINNLTIANNQLQEQLDDTYSSLYRDKRVAEIIKGKYEFITYKFNTLKPRVNKALKAIALVLNEPIKEKPNPMNDTYAPILYFTKRVVDQLLDNIEKDHNYLKRFGK